MTLIKEATEHLVHKIVPTLVPSISGIFQVKLIGVYRHHAEIQLGIVDKTTQAVLQSFASKILPIGGQCRLPFNTKFNPVPVKFQKDVAPQNINVQFQVRILGVSDKEAEIELRLVDPNNLTPVMSFGSKVKKTGELTILHGLDTIVSILSKELI